MAIVKIYDDEAEDLPRVCMKCGQPATTFLRKTFPGYNPAYIAEEFTGRLMTVDVPLCDNHRFHWLIFNVVGMGGPAFLLATILLAVLAVPAQAGNARETFIGCVTFSTIGFVTIWILTMIYLYFTRIRASQADKFWMGLDGVSEAFCEALDDQRNEAAISDEEREGSHGIRKDLPR